MIIQCHTFIGRSTKASSSEDKSSVSDGEAEMFGTIKGDDPVNYYSNNSPLSLAEQILFPPNDIESSDEEDSDWIVSDDDSELMNINELDLMNIQKPLCYHFESKSCETREAILKTENASLTSDVKQDSITSKTCLSGLLLHEAVNGEEPVSRLKELLPEMEGKLDTVDNHGKSWSISDIHYEYIHVQVLLNLKYCTHTYIANCTTPYYRLYSSNVCSRQRT